MEKGRLPSGELPGFPHSQSLHQVPERNRFVHTTPPPTPRREGSLFGDLFIDSNLHQNPIQALERAVEASQSRTKKRLEHAKQTRIQAHTLNDDVAFETPLSMPVGQKKKGVHFINEMRP